VPPTWHLHGFDVSPSQYPVLECLPANVSLDVLDAFDVLPPELHGEFDIVHIRAFAAVVKGGNAGPLAKNLVQLMSGIPSSQQSYRNQAKHHLWIEPGGYLQWDEFDTITFAAHARSAEYVDKQSTDAIIEVWHHFAKKLDIQLQYDSSPFHTTFD